MRGGFGLLVGAWICVVATGQTPRVLPPGSVPGDTRLGDLKTLNDHFPFVVPDNAGDWYTRAEALKRRVLVANGLWPMPEKTPLNAVIDGKIERDGFSVEKVHFQSLPGHYVTGLLFRPTHPSASPSPGVLSPHGHGGRMQRHSDEEIKKQISQGGEHFESSGRTPKLTRCAQLARMGCVTFIFDMVGYADSVQIPLEVAHRHQDPRPEELQPDDRGWIFFSPEADLRLQSIMGLQTWNAIRALDFLASLPDVDPERLAVTGGSGGGTQSILLGAIDDRIKVSFPNGMVSTSMQGGCYCENCNLLRVGTGNVELAALFAPKPQAMTAADDWTSEMMEDGYPELKWLYAMIGDEADVYCRPMLHFKHNYNYVTRATMYQWMNRHLELGLDDPVIEQDYEPLSDEEATVWTSEHPAPTEVGIPHERAVCRWMDDQATKKLNEITPSDAESLEKFRRTLGGGWRVIFDDVIPRDVEYQSMGDVTKDEIIFSKGLVRDSARGAELPLLTARQGPVDSNQIVIWCTESGKSAAFDDRGKPLPLLTQLLASGATVLLPDVFGQGEFNPSARSSKRAAVGRRQAFLFRVYVWVQPDARCPPHGRRSGDRRARDQAKTEVDPTVGDGGRGVLGGTGRGLGGRRCRSCGDRHRWISLLQHPKLPGREFRSRGGQVWRPACVARASAPHSLAIVGEPELPSIVRDTYAAANASDSLQNVSDAVDEATVAWLLE